MFDVIVRINYVRMSQAHNGFQKWLRRNNISESYCWGQDAQRKWCWSQVGSKNVIKSINVGSGLANCSLSAWLHSLRAFWNVTFIAPITIPFHLQRECHFIRHKKCNKISQIRSDWREKNSFYLYPYSSCKENVYKLHVNIRYTRNYKLIR